ncbi:DNA-binding XRE family transcriptional regulator [Erwinia toletana]|uniref:DNA-binding XRE family transcriptional regulator n=1 Tax=Winslowiella toletana TaxID=92490 RepID=A0ABS4P9T1_9GAMM|nr:helix-turn-helix domain-containing protein [Winslowiella toletana]MBP2168880.1 DNA-binding XRE family transcriptional regulator [Winslowiella toletana]
MGKNLDNMLAELSASRRQHVEQLADEMLLEVQLYRLREELQLTQQALASKMGISQPTIAAIEKRGNDIKLSTMKRYVAALGGTIHINIEFPDGHHIALEM